MKNELKFFTALAIFLALLSACFYLPGIHAEAPLKEALFYAKLDNQSVQCQLCPRRCVIPDGKRGFCGVRENRGGILYTLVYAKPVSIVEGSSAIAYTYTEPTIFYEYMLDTAKLAIGQA